VEPHRSRLRLNDMIRRLLALGMVLALATGCSDGGVSPQIQAASSAVATQPAVAGELAGARWELRTIARQGQVWIAPENPGFWLTFSAGQWSGEDGCNDRSGVATYTPAAVRLSLGKATSFSCHGADAHRMAADFRALIGSPVTATVSEGVLTLTGPGAVFTLSNTTRPPPTTTLVGRLVGWYWRIRSTTVNGVTTVAPKGSRGAINFSDQQFDASDDCGNDWSGFTPVTYTDDSMTMPPVAVSAVPCPTSPLNTAYQDVLQGRASMVADGTTLTMSGHGGRLVFTRGPASVYKNDFLAEGPTKPLTAARVEASVAGVTWRPIAAYGGGGALWDAPSDAESATLTFGRGTFTIAYGCVRWTGPIAYTATGLASSRPQRSARSCRLSSSDTRLDIGVSLLLGDRFTAHRSQGTLDLAGGGVILDLIKVVPSPPVVAMDPAVLRAKLVGKPWQLQLVVQGLGARVVPADQKADVVFTATTFVAEVGCLRRRGLVRYTSIGVVLTPTSVHSCPHDAAIAATAAAYKTVFTGRPRLTFAGNGYLTVSAVAISLSLRRR
jgi:heat shock protein HslJ